MRVIFLSIVLWVYVPMHAQSSFDSLISTTKNEKQLLTDLPTEIVRIQVQASANITIQNNKVLNKFFSQEKKILKAIIKAGNENGDDLLKTFEKKYNEIINQCNLQPGENNVLSQYVGRVDSIETILQFLKINYPYDEKISEAIQAVGDLKSKMNQSENITRFIADRQTMLKSLVDSYTNLPGGLIKSVDKYSRQFQNYKRQVATWKTNLSEPLKTEETVLKILSKIPAFKSFWQENSQLAKLFGGTSVTMPSFAGLQSRQSVAQNLQQRFETEIGDAQQIIQEKLQAANSELNILKEKANRVKDGIGGDNLAIVQDDEKDKQPVKANEKKLEISFNLQTGTKAAYNFPVSNDLGLSIGYKFNDNIETGIGMSYKFGLGTSWKRIKFSHDGIGLRSYIDLKISPSQNGIRVLFSNLWLSGGYEQNYWQTFKDFPELKQVAWQASGLIGISKRIQVSSKFFKYAKMQVLWDFLSYKQVPVSQPIIFRIGYAIK
jgi:hypothetical protein